MTRLGGTISIVLLLTLCTSLLSAAPPLPPTATGDSAGIEFFESKIRPLLAENCYSCHSAKAEKLKGDLRLDSRDGILKGGESGSPAITPGNPDGSPLIIAVRYDEEGLQMPPKKKLEAAQIAHLEAWVTMGAPMPGDADRRQTTTTTSTRMSIEEGRKFWSFQKPREPKV